MRILAIDPAVRKVGWCVLEGGRVEDSGTLHLYTGKPWTERLATLTQFVSARAQEGVDVIACELPTGDHGNRATDRKLGAAFGVVLAVAAVHGLPFESVRPNEVRATGLHKRTSKPEWLAAVRFVPEPDEGDAIGVAFAAQVKLREKEWIK